MNYKIKSALISVFYKDGLDKIVTLLHNNGIKIYTTGGTQSFIESLQIPCIGVETITNYPSILGGRVKTLHPKIFGGILGKRGDATHEKDMKDYEIPEIDLVIVDLYPFEETVANTNEESAIIEKIDIGGPSMIRAAAKNHSHIAVIASKEDYTYFENLLIAEKGVTTLADRKLMATKAFQVVAQYDNAIANWFLKTPENNIINKVINGQSNVLRYGENPHQTATYYGNINEVFEQINGKALSYNNLVDVDGAMALIAEFTEPTFAIVKHTNACGIATAPTLQQAWELALAADPESAFGGVLCCNGIIDAQTASAIQNIFFEVLIATDYEEEAKNILQQKKNRIILKTKNSFASNVVVKNVLNGVLIQDTDQGNFITWNEVGGRNATIEELEDLKFANLICKHLKSNAIALVKNKQLIGKGCGQTSRVDALKYALEKANQFNLNLNGAVLASDAFFPFDDCVKMAHNAGITAFVQPGGSIRDEDSIAYTKQNNLAMVITGQRHFKH